jgi:hypothetical protein
MTTQVQPLTGISCGDAQKDMLTVLGKILNEDESNRTPAKNVDVSVQDTPIQKAAREIYRQYGPSVFCR